MPSVLSIGQSALAAAQAGLATTGHNVANASSSGYNRQVVVQTSTPGQNQGFGYIGGGTQIATVARVYDEFLSSQVVSAQSSKSRLDTYYAQVKRLDSLVADPQTGISPVLQDFFKGVQNITADPNGAASRQALLSSATTLVGGFQTLDNYFSEMRAGVNSEITTSISSINTYAQQIAKLNDAIEKAMGSMGSKPANDLLDQRDQLINDLSKELKVSVAKQGQSYNVFVGNGQPLILGAQTFEIATTPHPSDPQRLQIGYAINGGIQTLPESTMSGGRLGGLLEFRQQSLGVTQNALGRMAIGLAMTFNEQHRLGMTHDGAMNRDFFNIDLTTSVTQNDIEVTSEIVNPSQLTTSDYQLQYDGENYNITRLSDGTIRSFPAMSETMTMDGVDFSVSPTPPEGSYFLLRPNAEAISSLSVAVTNQADIAVSAPVVTGAPLANSGTGTINAGAVNSDFDIATAEAGVELTYHENETATEKWFTGFPFESDDFVSVTVNGKPVPGSPFTANGRVPYTAGAKMEFAGIEIVVAGAPVDGDTFTIGKNLNHEGDSRNAILLGALQQKSIFNSGTTTYQGVYAQLVSTIGNQTREAEVTSAAAGKLYNQTFETQQSMSGVNLDEEAANLVRYQQAYQAAGKLMQTATELFDTLLQIGR